ncbi:uncharacterized protein LOC116257108 [Nymphaea colorata]|nr:uncharacterized protein LOC116257108 [Nymphaea colorata]
MATTPLVDRTDISGDQNESPFVVHHSDNPGAILVTNPLVGDNYFTWRWAMKMALSAKNKFGFVDANSVIYASEAHEVWIDLQERFSQGKAAHIYQFKKMISDLRQERNSLAVYFTTLKTFWDELGSYSTVSACTCGAFKEFHSCQDHEKVYQFLMVLNESFSNLRSQILAIDPLPNINRVYTMLLQEETQRLLTPKMSGSNNIALAARSSPTSYTKRNKARMPNATRNRPRPKCDHCGMLGHIKSRCYVLHGYPPNHPKAAGSTGDSSKIEKAQQGGTLANNVKVSAVLSQLTEEQIVKENQKLHKGSVEIEDDSASLADVNILPGDVLWVTDTEVHENRDIADELLGSRMEFEPAEEGFKGTLLASNGSVKMALCNNCLY